MANLTKTSWPLGWIPSADNVDGPPDALLRMDNLQQEENNVLGLVRGMKQQDLKPLSDYPRSLYSKNVENKEVEWAALGDRTSLIVFTKDGTWADGPAGGPFFLGNNADQNPGSDYCAFDDFLGQVLITAGTCRWKASGKETSTAAIDDGGTRLGIPTPWTPFTDALSQQQALFSANYVAVVGTLGVNTTAGYQATVDGTNFISQVIGTYITGLPFDTTRGFQGDTSKDLFTITLVSDPVPKVLSVQVDFLLDIIGNNYYSFKWDGPIDIQTIYTTDLSCRRQDFTRHGTDATLNWTTVRQIRITIIAIENLTFNVTLPIFTVIGQLNGTYQYRIQSGRQYGSYIAKSPGGQISDPITVINGSITISGLQSAGGTPIIVGDIYPPIYYIYRKSVQTSDVQPTSFLSKWYLVAVTTNDSFFDNRSDISLLEENEILNEFLLTLQLVGGPGSPDPNALTDTIYDIEPFQTRVLYMANSFIYISDDLNPDAVDTRYTIKTFGDTLERNLWIKKVSNNVLCLGTSKNLYEITGTLGTLPDGTIDITIVPIGEAYPPLGREAWTVNGGIFYVASDGIRITRGAHSTLLSPQLKLLFQGMNRNGVPPISIVPNANIAYPITAGKTKLYASLPLQDGSRRLFVYDLLAQTFTLRQTAPLSLFTTPTDKVLAGYLGPVTNASDFIQYGLPLFFQTIFDANAQPRNRKDTFTLKLVCDTGGSLVTVSIAKDRGTFTALGNVQATGMTTIYFPLDGVTLGFRYALKIVDIMADVTVFKLYESTIEYDPRPEQLDYLRIPNSNLGVYARKRITSYPFVIDTLGNSVSFTPYVDNVALVPQIFSTAVKLTRVNYFLQETIGTDIGGILRSIDPEGPFEFYQALLEEAVSEKLPTPAEFLFIPQENFGYAGRKRIRTIPLVILTNGKDVLYTPIVDGILQSHTTVFNTTRKTTVYHFFIDDMFGVDVGGTLYSPSGPFEFYGFGQQEDVEGLPVPKRFDQIGPIRFDKIGKIFNLRTRLVATGATPIALTIYGDANVTDPANIGTPIYSGTLPVVVGVDNVYELQMPKSINTTVARIVLGPAIDYFHRYDMQIRVSLSGMESDSKWIPVR